LSCMSKDVRNELGRRIEDGVPGMEIVDWLNSRPDVQRIMEEQFGGRVITEQNLSEWRKSGHVDWLRREEAKAAAVRLVEEANELEEAADTMSLSDRFGIVLAAEMTRLAAKLLEAEADPEKRWKRLCEINRELSQLRRDDHRAVRESIRQERWRREQEREEDELAAREAQEAKRRRINLTLSPAWNHEVAKMFGGGETGKAVGRRHKLIVECRSRGRENIQRSTFNIQRPRGKQRRRNPRESRLIGGLKN
jgi:hypothetical protein